MIGLDRDPAGSVAARGWARRFYQHWNVYSCEVGTMRNRVLLLVALGCAISLLAVPSASACAICPSSTPASHPDDPDKIIPVSWPSESLATNCAYHQSACPLLEDIAYKDIDVSDELEDYEEWAYFRVGNKLPGTTLWFACAYDGEGEPTQCYYDDFFQRNWPLYGDLSPDVVELRIFPIQSPATYYLVDVFTG